MQFNSFTNMSVALITLLLPLTAIAVPVDSPQPEAREIDPGCTLTCSLWNYCLIRNLTDRTKCGEEPTGCECSTFAF
ncbi:hypothetical protein EPUS_00922 [Endocarpon pusillum Z07020]|uniref:Extracellular membrane protein CFEM domain-containing protein n=1 Tax=Endocarpon pusillum (strain Z07020 / HMAS-L-300199) TaxID=1263415 RepID=U1HWB8_ENDPU|nr:uncharacterized protein EPUS_00922 [Endocarpon pusillum Z07020]ERF73669.1 hypothetical protein EPUS_00922 [Endocarpon pusillum Z07020]